MKKLLICWIENLHINFCVNPFREFLKVVTLKLGPIYFSLPKQITSN